MSGQLHQYYDSSRLFHGSMTGIMGTRFDIVLPTGNRSGAEKLWADISAELYRLEKMLNRFGPQSELSKINLEARQKPVTVSAEMGRILAICGEYHRKTSGYFDVTLNDFTKVHIDKNAETVFFSGAISLDMGGFAKGYAMARIRQMILQEGFLDAFVDFGNSSVTALGRHPHGDCWKVSIENPFKKGEFVGEIELRNAALSTSGNTPSYSEHIIQPSSGKYTDEKKLVCVVAPDELDAEILTTALMAAPDNEREKIVRNFVVDKYMTYIL